MFQNIYIEVQVYAGSNIVKVCNDAAELAERLEVPVMFKFNGVEVFVSAGHRATRADRAINAIQHYNKAINRIG